jgi:hypothetical protein
VNIGDILTLESKITYTEKVESGVLMRVVTKAFVDSGKQSNMFSFIFLMKDAKRKARLIKPETFDEILDYHEAIRRLSLEPIEL